MEMPFIPIRLANTPELDDALGAAVGKWRC